MTNLEKEKLIRNYTLDLGITEVRLVGEVWILTHARGTVELPDDFGNWNSEYAGKRIRRYVKGKLSVLRWLCPSK